MPELAFPLVGFVLWTVVLLSAMLLWRGVTILKRERKIHEFPSGEHHGPDMYWRMNRAHLNALENLPMFVAVVVAAMLTGASNPVLVTAAWVAFYARVGQSLVHIAFHNQISVTIRFTFFIAQIAAFAYMGLVILRVL